MSKTILVTGGVSGIGRAITEAALGKGWRVIAADMNADTVAACARELAGHGDRLECVQLDVTDEAAVVDLVGRIARDKGPLDGVVNSAGIGADVPAVETSVALFRKMMDVNVIGSFLVAREAAKAMRRTGGGSIVNIASVSGMLGNEGRVAYGASKGGAITMSRVLAVEFAPIKVRVNVISPGPIETPMVAAIHTETSRKVWTDSVPQRRYGAPDDIAQAALFLLDGSLSGYITGQTLAVDGGFTTAGLMTGMSEAATLG